MRIFPPIDRQAQIRENSAEIASLYETTDSLVILWHQGKVLIENNDLKYYSPKSLIQTGAALSEPLYLGQLDEQHIFVQALEQLDAHFSAMEMANLRKVGLYLDDQKLGLLFYAQGLLNWHQTHGYCANCGTQTVLVSAGHSRKCPNETCGKSHFPRIEPAVIFSVINNEEAESKILLARQASWDENRYSVLAGFVESGETLENAVEREAYEEVGIQVSEVNYVASQPWPFPSSLMLGFESISEEYDIQLNDDEIEKAIWVSAAELTEHIAAKTIKLPFSVSISWHLIDRWYRDQTGQSLKSLK
ncbi:NAD(+) diphosphatase [Aliikangiella marina]|uniref:NAD(+) diphosphatase n=1 Tax=Aliikangiella marina TaxID=1712262 RepID=A0A545T326_9GAMM|nr:NAD(+) diphosphatase [Aliikangiella marina]TQV71624.1 NAD(+) diphosphatase [Aliikangiella marina]